MRVLNCLVIVILISLVAGSCHKIQQLPETPRIEFTNFEVFDTFDILGNNCKGGRLNFYFEDGNGDIGLQVPDTNQTDTTNLFLKLFRKVEGIMVQVSDSGDLMKPSNYRIPYIERTGQNKIIKGTITVTFTYTFYEPADSDIFRYDFYIKDRAENISNTESTCEFALSVNDIYYN